MDNHVKGLKRRNKMLNNKCFLVRCSDSTYKHLAPGFPSLAVNLQNLNFEFPGWLNRQITLCCANEYIFLFV